MNSAARRRFVKLPGQSEVAQSTANASSQARTARLVVSAVQHRSGMGIGVRNKRVTNSRTNAKIYFVKRVCPARSMTRSQRAVSSRCISMHLAISRSHEDRIQERNECLKA